MNSLKTMMMFSSTYIWMGFTAANAFIEYWLEFKIPINHSNVVFEILKELYYPLNNLEWIFPLVLIWIFIFQNQTKFTIQLLLFLIPLFILGFQTSQLLPLLHCDINFYLEDAVSLHNEHFVYYLTTEVVKIASLLVFAIYSYWYCCNIDLNKTEDVEYIPGI